MSKISEKIKELENLKYLLSKYPDLEMITNTYLVSKSNGYKCDKFEFVQVFGNVYLRLYFEELNYKIFVTESFNLSNFKNKENFIEYLIELNISKNLIDHILKLIPISDDY